MQKIVYILLGMALVTVAFCSFAAVAGVGGGGGGEVKPHPGPVPLPDDLKDPDGDGLITAYEYDIGTDPYNPDTDGDGLIDGMEVELGLDANDWDSDGDLLADGSELGANGKSTDGHFTDTDNDGIDGTPDDETKPYQGPPLPDTDPDNDDVPTEVEYEIGTDPNNADTDGDGLSDGAEIKFGLDPNDWDTDNDMLTDGCELGSDHSSTDGHFTDTDNDGI